ncbi:hypothetical protein TNCV_1402591 [Trichonephila clavipes]|nr:hypothetical protein TNCV_1402591 [Trichonephila clavipes]
MDPIVKNLLRVYTFRYFLPSRTEATGAYDYGHELVARLSRIQVMMPLMTVKSVEVVYSEENSFKNIPSVLADIIIKSGLIKGLLLQCSIESISAAVRLHTVGAIPKGMPHLINVG